MAVYTKKPWYKLYHMSIILLVDILGNNELSI